MNNSLNLTLDRVEQNATARMRSLLSGFTPPAPPVSAPEPDYQKLLVDGYAQTEETMAEVSQDLRHCSSLLKTSRQMVGGMISEAGHVTGDEAATANAGNGKHLGAEAKQLTDLHRQVGDARQEAIHDSSEAEDKFKRLEWLLVSNLQNLAQPIPKVAVGSSQQLLQQGAYWQRDVNRHLEASPYGTWRSESALAGVGDVASDIAKDKNPSKGGSDVSAQARQLTGQLWKVAGLIDKSDSETASALTSEGIAQGRVSSSRQALPLA